MDDLSHDDDAAARQEATACLGGLQPSAVEQQAALQRVLDLSECVLTRPGSPEHASGSPGSDAAAAADGGGERRLWWLCARLRALQHLERLATSLELHGGCVCSSLEHVGLLREALLRLSQGCLLCAIATHKFFK